MASEILQNAYTVRFRTHNGKYLYAAKNEKSVRQGYDGALKNANWTVEFVEHDGQIYMRFKSCYGKYLTASNMPFVPRVKGLKVTQTLPSRLSSATEWEVEKEGPKYRLKTRYGHFLRPYGWLPPWRNGVAHDIPHLKRTRPKILWEIEVVEPLMGHRRAHSDSMVKKPMPFEVIKSFPERMERV